MTTASWPGHVLAFGTRSKHFLQRLQGRIKNGLIMQDLLDALGRTGIIVCPYFIALEPGTADQAVSLPAQCTVRRLTAADAPQMVRITLRPPDLAALVAHLQQSYCLGMFQDADLAAYTWGSTKGVPVPDAGGAVLFELAADEAYFFDMYVAPAYRGTRLAGLLRQAIQAQMAALGRQRFYSISMAFNRSSRRFKARLGTREMELRLCLQLRWGRLSGIDFRLRRWEAQLRSPFWTPVRAPAEPTHG